MGVFQSLDDPVVAQPFASFETSASTNFFSAPSVVPGAPGSFLSNQFKRFRFLAPLSRHKYFLPKSPSQK